MLFPNNGMEEFTINKVAITGGTGPVGAAFVKKCRNITLSEKKF